MHRGSLENQKEKGQIMDKMQVFRKNILAFIGHHRISGDGAGRYRYSVMTDTPTLYSSTYAAMTRSLLDDLKEIGDGDRTEWVGYLNGHQDDDGLFRDPVIFNQGCWYKDDPLWCGRPHLTCHVIIALTCLGAAAAKPFRWLDQWREPDALIRWLEERDWGARVSWTGNEIMNVGTLLQYSRDFHNDTRAGKAVAVLLEWMASHHINPETGVWGAVDVRDPVWRSHAVMAAYHLWPLFFYDKVPVPYVERAVDTVLATQNQFGGFGCGVHNGAEPSKSSACEDIDSIDPLCRMSRLTDYRRADIRAALTKAADWVLTNQMPDGGFVFIKDRPFEYGHCELRSEANQGAMFPTWFRTLSLALLGSALPEHALGKIQWKFARCPGMQFWERNNVIESLD